MKVAWKQELLPGKPIQHGEVMKDRVVFLLATVLLFAATEAYGQAPRRMLQGGACLHRDCLSLQGLRLSDEQRQAIQEIELAYSDRMNGIQNRLLGKLPGRMKRQSAQRLWRFPNSTLGAGR
jgi:hypothetical protein